MTKLFAAAFAAFILSGCAGAGQMPPQSAAPGPSAPAAAGCAYYHQGAFITAPCGGAVK